MEAVIATGGKQYRVVPGQVIRVERLSQPAGTAVEFGSVLLVNRDGQVVVDPSALSGARVLGEVVAQSKAPKVTVVKFKRRRNYRRNLGHRQPVTAVRITTIEV
jgi:large subunit ribosomal protein L21